MTDAERLHVRLEASLLKQLGATWDEINQNHFGGHLRRPVLALDDTSGRLGAWNGARRTLSVARVLVLDRPWGVVREVLKHEVAHQFVEEAMGITDQTAHGPAFEQVCRQHGFDARAAGMPTVDTATDGDLGGGSPILRRIARLLALAESPNLHEAEAAMKAAQRLMLKHNLDEAVLAARDGFTFRHVGIPRGRAEAAEHVLAGLVSRHFFVEAIWVPSYLAREGVRGRVLELAGTPSNLEVAAYVHGFLLETAVRLWREHKRALALPGNRERRRFQLGVMIGFEEKLRAGEAENRKEGLVWKGNPALGAYLRRRYPRQSGGSRFGFQRTEAYESGRRAGREIVLHRPVAATNERRGRLLT